MIKTTSHVAPSMWSSALMKLMVSSSVELDTICLEDESFPKSVRKKEEKIINMALSKSVSDTIVEKVNANFGTRRLFRIIDFIQILFLRLN